MQEINFHPIITDTPCRCFPCWRICDVEKCTDTYELVRKRMEDWIEENEDKIRIINIETLDYVTDDFLFKKMHFRIWYTHK